MGILQRRFVRVAAGPVAKMLFVAAALAVGATALAPRTSHAALIDFATTGTAGDLGFSFFIDPGTGLRVDGFYMSDGAWLAANLYRRDQTNDHGFGICNPVESACPGPLGGGNVNELDNKNQNELIRLTLPAGFEWASVGVSSVDTEERGVLYSDADGIPSTTFGSIGDTTLNEFEAGGDIEFTIAIMGSATTAPFLFFEPFDWKYAGLNDDNDYLVWNAELTAVPLPAALPLFLSALAGLAFIGRRQRKKAAA